MIWKKIEMFDIHTPRKTCQKANLVEAMNSRRKPNIVAKVDSIQRKKNIGGAN